MADPSSQRQRILEMTAGFMPTCAVGAAAELDVWSVIGPEPLTARQVAERLKADLRATTMLLDAVAALGLLDKQAGRYAVPDSLAAWLCEEGPDTLLPMLRHRMNILRGWAQLAWTVRAGIPAPQQGSIRGPAADRAAFVAAMHSVSGPVADELIARLGPPRFTHLLDVGGASGTWTLAFLRTAPDARATLFDLPDAVEQARRRISESEAAGRVDLVPGDFYTDPLPAGADYAWVSAIVHQHSREHNRALFEKVYTALVPGGRIGIRDIVMQPDKVQPVEGALFAINMLVNTETGGTFSFAELAADLQAAGFIEPELRIEDPAMNSVVEAVKPQ